MFVAQAVPARMVDSTFKPDLKWSTSLTDKIQKSVTDPISDSDKHLHHINKAYMLCNNQQIPTTQAEILTLFFPLPIARFCPSVTDRATASNRVSTVDFI